MNYIDFSELNDSLKSLINNLIFQYTEIVGIKLLENTHFTDKEFIKQEGKINKNITSIDYLKKAFQNIEENIHSDFKKSCYNFSK